MNTKFFRRRTHNLGLHGFRYMETVREESQVVRGFWSAGDTSRPTAPLGKTCDEMKSGVYRFSQRIKQF